MASCPQRPRRPKCPNDAPSSDRFPRASSVTVNDVAASSTPAVPDVPEERKLRTFKVIAGELRVDEKTARKFATRKVNRLPVMHDHSGDWIDKVLFVAWVAGETKSYADWIQEKRAKKGLPVPRRAPERQAS
jgi:hypothetical protein